MSSRTPGADSGDVPELPGGDAAENKVDPAADDAISSAAASALARARVGARDAGFAPTNGPTPRRRRHRPQPPVQFSTARADGRDPVLLGPQLDRLLNEYGWEDDLAVGSVVARWAAVVGPDVAQHVTPVGFENGVLTVQSDSTSWAVNLRYMTPLLLERFAAEIGSATVKELAVLGPAAPSWRRGGRGATGGRGPRDTYG